MSITCQLITMDYDKDNCNIIIHARNIKNFKKIKLIVTGFEPYFYVNEEEEVPENKHIVRVFLIDKKIFCVFRFPTEHNEIEPDVYSCNHKYVKPADKKLAIDPLINAVDVEVNAKGRLPEPKNKENYLTCVTTFDNMYNYYISYLLSKKSTRWLIDNGHSVIPCKNEKDLLLQIKRYYDKVKPDVAGGWNVDFDINYLQKRGKMFNIKFNFEGISPYDFLAGYDMLSNRKLGKRLKDVVINEGIESEDNLVASEYHNELWEDESQHKDLVIYNKNDVKYTLIINKMYNIIDFFWRLKNNTGLEDIRSTEFFNVSIDVDYLRESELPMPTRVEIPKHKRSKVKGGYVIQPDPGIYKDIVVLDFSKFYPSILIAYNLSKELMHLPEKERLKHPLGLTPRVCLKLIKEREYWDKRLKEILKEEGPESRDYKIAKLQRDVTKFRLNAVYGFGLYYKSRIYSPECMGTMLEIARGFIKKIEIAAKKHGFKIQYGDTDSVMGKCPRNRINEFEKVIQDTINQAAKETGLIHGTIDIKAERYADKGIWIRKKGGGKGAKKKYILHVTWEEGKECDYLYTKGMELIRGDQSKITKNVQQNLIKAIFEGNVEQEIQKIRSMISGIENDKYDYDDIAIGSNISKNFEEYKQMTQVVRGAQYSNEYCGTEIGKGDKPKLLFVKTIPGMPRTDVICYLDKKTLPKSLVIDKELTIERTITSKIETLLEICNYNLNDLKNIKSVSCFL